MHNQQVNNGYTHATLSSKYNTKMHALIIIAPIYLILYLFIGLKDLKKFLLLTAIISLPLRTTFSLIFSSHYGWSSGIQLSLSDMSLIGLFIYSLLNRANKFHIDLYLLAPMGLFVAACCLSAINSTARGFTFYQVITFAQICFLYFFVFRSSLRSENDINSVLLYLTISVFFQALIGLIQYATGMELDVFSTGHAFDDHKLIAYGEEAEVLRIFGTVGRPNSFASYMASITILNLSLLLIGGFRKWYRIAAIALGSLCVLLTFSRGVWIATVIVLVILLIVLIRERRVALRKIMLFGFIGAAVVICFLPAIHERIFGDDMNSAGSRIPLIRLAFNMIEAHPILGVGANTFENTMKEYASGDLAHVYLYQVHNQYLLVLAETGIFGISAFLWLLARLCRQSIRCFTIRGDRMCHSIGLGVLLVTIASMIHMNVDLYTSRLLLGNMFLLTAVSSACINIHNCRRHKKMMTLVPGSATSSFAS